MATGVLTGDFPLEEEEEAAGLEVGVEAEETERALKESARPSELTRVGLEGVSGEWDWERDLRGWRGGLRRVENSRISSRTGGGKERSSSLVLEVLELSVRRFVVTSVEFLRFRQQKDQLLPPREALETVKSPSRTCSEAWSTRRRSKSPCRLPWNQRRTQRALPRPRLTPPPRRRSRCPSKRTRDHLRRTRVGS